MRALNVHTTWVLFAECLELGAGWWFYFVTNDKPEVQQWVITGELVWLCWASLRLFAVRVVAAAFGPGRDVYSWCAHAAALKVDADLEVTLRKKATDAGNAVAMSRKRRRLQMVAAALLVHIPNAFFVGMSHIQYKITAASATTQVPSIYLACFYLVRAICVPPKDPPPGDSTMPERDAEAGTLETSAQ